MPAAPCSPDPMMAFHHEQQQVPIAANAVCCKLLCVGRAQRRGGAHMLPRLLHLLGSLEQGCLSRAGVHTPYVQGCTSVGRRGRLAGRAHRRIMLKSHCS